MLILAFLAAFSAFGTACDTCQDQITRGWALICLLLAVVYFGTLKIAGAQDAVRGTATMLAGGLVGLIVVIFTARIVMPL